MARSPRSSRLSAASRRDQILDAAQPLFAAHGFHGTTTRQIAAAANVSDALLYRHFTSKADLMNAMVNRAISAFAELPPPAALHEAPFQALLERIGAMFVDRAQQHVEILVILLGDYRSVDDLRFVIFIDAAATSLGRLIAKRVEHVDPDEGYLLARSYFGSLISYVLLQRVLKMEQIHHVDSAMYIAATATPLASFLDSRRA